MTVRRLGVIQDSPARVLVLGFAAVIALGTLLLLIPAATAPGRETDLLTALFTATSATCVTGLVVVDTATHWSWLGHLIIVLLIQVGGLGIMTMSTFFALLIGKRVTLRERLVIQEALGHPTLAGIVRLVRLVLLTTALCEGAGMLLLFVQWVGRYPVPRALALAAFHSVSAFNNAGFDLFSVSLQPFVEDAGVVLTMAALIITGGIGFIVLADLWSMRRNHRRVTLHTCVVLRVTALLIVFGTLFILVLEWANPLTLGPLSLKGKVLAAFFQAVTPRTAGFNVVPTGGLTVPTLLLTIVFMFIGASPGGTGGGIKTTTFASLVLAVWATVRGYPEIVVRDRRLPWEVVRRALAITFISLTLVVVVSMALSLVEEEQYLPLLFEATSAFGTVGLSTGVTPDLSAPGRVLVILTMFAGRVGPLTLAIALAKRNRPLPPVQYLEEKVAVG